MVILDTCALIELLRESPALKKGTLSRLKEGVGILSVCFAEIAIKQKKGQLSFHGTIEELYQNYLELETSQIVSIGVQEWLDAIHLEWKHKDPADRLIVAYAKRRGCPIVTSDREIKKYYDDVLW